MTRRIETRSIEVCDGDGDDGGSQVDLRVEHGEDKIDDQLGG
ncbi:MAG: hypothetical protein ACRD0U_13945 [Acidimicrobiales bacterium]